MVIGADNKAAYREVTLGGFVDGLRMVTMASTPASGSCEWIAALGAAQARCLREARSMTGSDQAQVPAGEQLAAR